MEKDRRTASQSSASSIGKHKAAAKASEWAAKRKEKMEKARAKKEAKEDEVCEHHTFRPRTGRAPVDGRRVTGLPARERSNSVTETATEALPRSGMSACKGDRQSVRAGPVQKGTVIRSNEQPPLCNDAGAASGRSDNGSWPSDVYQVNDVGHSNSTAATMLIGSSYSGYGDMLGSKCSLTLGSSHETLVPVSCSGADGLLASSSTQLPFADDMTTSSQQEMQAGVGGSLTSATFDPSDGSLVRNASFGCEAPDSEEMSISIQHQECSGWLPDTNPVSGQASALEGPWVSLHTPPSPAMCTPNAETQPLAWKQQQRTGRGAARAGGDRWFPGRFEARDVRNGSDLASDCVVATMEHLREGSTSAPVDVLAGSAGNATHPQAGSAGSMRSLAWENVAPELAGSKLPGRAYPAAGRMPQLGGGGLQSGTLWQQEAVLDGMRFGMTLAKETNGWIAMQDLHSHMQSTGHQEFLFWLLHCSRFARAGSQDILLDNLELALGDFYLRNSQESSEADPPVRSFSSSSSSAASVTPTPPTIFSKPESFAALQNLRRNVEERCNPASSSSSGLGVNPFQRQAVGEGMLQPSVPRVRASEHAVRVPWREAPLRREEMGCAEYAQYQLHLQPRSRLPATHQAVEKAAPPLAAPSTMPLIVGHSSASSSSATVVRPAEPSPVLVNSAHSDETERSRWRRARVESLEKKCQDLEVQLSAAKDAEMALRDELLNNTCSMPQARRDSPDDWSSGAVKIWGGITEHALAREVSAHTAAHDAYGLPGLPGPSGNSRRNAGSSSRLLLSPVAEEPEPRVLEDQIGSDEMEISLVGGSRDIPTPGLQTPPPRAPETDSSFEEPALAEMQRKLAAAELQGDATEMQKLVAMCDQLRSEGVSLPQEEINGLSTLVNRLSQLMERRRVSGLDSNGHPMDSPRAFSSLIHEPSARERQTSGTRETLGSPAKATEALSSPLSEQLSSSEQGDTNQTRPSVPKLRGMPAAMVVSDVDQDSVSPRDVPVLR